ncbi:SAM-dependent methyltransferase [Salegentibacter salinarum]|uniref:SAM-dependent methyltransferase n=1 Tax=Salegentibacter salinarum TaxID=447422 RepID=A0A2N0TND8_9FLAO|nr:TIGR04290 family methyltransferase [Salegentibacter salinarum]PKD16208.1 SAM-dependent methyltransferase [Salegentibacter salinarum]SKB67907.1 tRNA (mo5U34)-methyltransferase [Salegentibacter salinarum]
METEKKIEELAPWFHNLHLPDGLQTAPNHFLGDFPQFKWEKIKHEIPEDLQGMEVLDIGCNAGFYAISLARRGAKVTAIDLDDHYLNQAKWAAEKFNVSNQIEFKNMQVYDLAQEDKTYDLIWFMGVFYHLRYPLLAMDIISRKTSDYLVFQSLSLQGSSGQEVPENVDFEERHLLESEDWPSMAFIEKKFAGDLTNWWVPNAAAIKGILNNCGFKIIASPEDETYIARKNNAISHQERWNNSEYLSAIGKNWRDEVKDKINKY